MFKKFLLTLMLIIGCFTSKAQSQMSFTATSLAIATVNEYTGQYTWSAWQQTRTPIVFDLMNDVVYIYSNSPQRYTLVSDGREYVDSGGGRQVEYKIVDQDGDRGSLRLRIERNGNSQLYVDFADIAWCYNLVRNMH